MTAYRDNMIKKYGSLEAWRIHQRQIGALGGAKKVPKGFATMDKAKAFRLRSKGGLQAHKNKENN